MSGGRPFDRQRFDAAVDVATRSREAAGFPLTADWLAWFCMQLDFGAYRLAGKAMTGATYLKGERHPEVRELGVGWFERFAWKRTPTWAKVAGRCVALAVVVGAPRRGGRG